MRRELSSICRIIACTRRVRRLSSSTSVSILRRRRMNRCRASSHSARGVRRLISLRKSSRFCSSRCCERPQVVRHAGDDLLFGQPLGQRDLDRAVEGQDAVVHFVQRVDRGLHREIAAEHRAAESLPRDLDLLGQRDFFFARQQRNLRHLRQIHADRIVAQLWRIRGPHRQRHVAHRLELFGLQFVGPAARRVVAVAGRVGRTRLGASVTSSMPISSSATSKLSSFSGLTASSGR